MQRDNYKIDHDTAREIYLAINCLYVIGAMLKRSPDTEDLKKLADMFDTPKTCPEFHDVDTESDENPLDAAIDLDAGILAYYESQLVSAQPVKVARKRKAKS
jgi:hypothetical protein